MRVPSGGGDGEHEFSEETMVAAGVGRGAHGIDRQTDRREQRNPRTGSQDS